MTIGEKIKNARNLRGLTQRELGMKLGFDEKSADVRIAQYESGTRTPKSELLSEIAAVLDVNINFLKNPSLENTETIINHQRNSKPVKNGKHRQKPAKHRHNQTHQYHDVQGSPKLIRSIPSSHKTLQFFSHIHSFLSGS